jgi:hydrogenase maturation protein HypF
LFRISDFGFRIFHPLGLASIPACIQLSTMNRPSEARIAGSGSLLRLRVLVRGAVQGVGFRPFIYRLATELELSGWVNNSAQGVFIEAEGMPLRLEQFLLRIEPEKPPRSFIQSLESTWLDPAGYIGFEIRPSDTGGAKTALVLPDIATCPECLGELFAPANRRYLYPFTNCTNCGPRFSIIEALPYDRANTSMKGLAMCPQCRAEYEDPLDRRFHAQPNACPNCGPQLELWDHAGAVLAVRGDALLAAGQGIREGKIVALKGLGGFHLLVSAQNEQAVKRLRELKHREEKPFAVMFPSLAVLKQACEVSPLEERLLRSAEAPIVLLRRHAPAAGLPPLSNSIAPANPNLGVLLPYTPLHHVLLADLGFPVVATSGNLSDEPICIDEREALSRLRGLADLFLVHNRPIVRHVDDSIVRVMMGRELVLRRARGYAPLPIRLGAQFGGREVNTGNVLAVGAHLKNTIALSVGQQAFISQHIGDLETDQAFEAFRRIIKDFERLYETQPSIIATDAHPDYLSSKFARELVSQERTPDKNIGQPPTRTPAGGPAMRYITVQHHVAHVLSCMAENELAPPVLGVSWDGTGYGLDGTVWGGEFFLVTAASCDRVAHLRPFRLPGGDASVKEPRRTALGLLFEHYGEAAFERTELAPVRAFSPAELSPIRTMLVRQLNSPLTSSIGRLFDAVASLIGLRQRVRFEGQAAMELEFALDQTITDEAYPFPIHAPRTTHHAPQYAIRNTQYVLNWSPMLEAILADLTQGVPAARISARFHNALVEALILITRQVAQPLVALSGGCFQNRYLTERAVQRLREEGFRPYWHQRVPPNDGGISLGQVVAALRETV